MLKRLEAHPDVTGLICYGSDHQEDNYSVGDYDLFVVFFSWQPLVESLHFRVGHTPVDLNLITLETLAGLAPAFTFPQLALGDAALIFDRTGQVEPSSWSRLQDMHSCSTSLGNSLRHTLLHLCVTVIGTCSRRCGGDSRVNRYWRTFYSASTLTG